ncbi:MAG: hypothetical protein V4610_19400 [Pseudomonadota bacterium]
MSCRHIDGVMTRAFAGGAMTVTSNDSYTTGLDPGGTRAGCG